MYYSMVSVVVVVVVVVVLLCWELGCVACGVRNGARTRAARSSVPEISLLSPVLTGPSSSHQAGEGGGVFAGCGGERRPWCQVGWEAGSGSMAVCRRAAGCTSQLAVGCLAL